MSLGMKMFASRSVFVGLLLAGWMSGQALAQQPAPAAPKAPAAAPAAGAPKQPSKQELANRIGWVYFYAGRIMAESAAGRKLNADIQAAAKRTQDEVKARTEALRKEGEALEKQRVSLTPEQFEAKTKALFAKNQELQKFRAQKTRGFNEGQRNALVEIDKAMHEAVKQVAIRYGVAAVFRGESTYIAIPTLDVTDDVMAAFNKQLPAVKFNPTSGSTAAPPAKKP